MTDEYSGTILKRSHHQHSVTHLWLHTVPDDILHKKLKFRQFTYTAALFTATVLLLLMELTEHRTKCTVRQPFTVPQLPINRDRTAERSNRITAFLKVVLRRAWKHVYPCEFFWLHSDCRVATLTAGDTVGWILVRWLQWGNSFVMVSVADMTGYMEICSVCILT